MNTLVALPAGSPAGVLQTILASNPAIQPRVIIDGLGAVIEAPTPVVAALSAFPGVAAAVTGALPAGLPVNPVLQPWIDAWNKQFDPAYQASLAARPAKWLTTGNPPPGASGTPAPPTSTLDGTVAFGLVTVNGPAAAALSPSDVIDINLGVLNAIGHLTRNAPDAARLVFVIEWQPVTLVGVVDPLSIPGPIPNSTFDDQENPEKQWRDPALAAIGQPAGFPGVTNYRNALLGRTWWGGVHADKSIVGFVSRYNTAMSAYAAMGRLVVNLPQTDVFPGRIHIDRVVAHEMCHLFEAQDEYDGCAPFVMSGPFHAVNGNCISNPLATLGQAPCLMAGTSDDLCNWTKAHVGWQPFP